MKISQNVIWGKFAIQLWAAVLLGAMGGPAAAQIVPDQTLGAEGSRATSNVLIRGASGDLVEGGAVRGSNLFHSFQQFNVNNNQRVYFANPVGVQNIFSRVTGSNASNILGTLGVDGNANLFLLNPNGILFGRNAQLDIRGSFLATTADRFTFPDGSTFGASNPQAAPLLTMSAPVGVQYGKEPGTITNQGNLATGQNLTLAANNLDLQGQMRSGGDLTLQAQDTVKIRDSATQPFVAASGGQLLVQGTQKIDISALSHPDSKLSAGGDLLLRSSNPVRGDAHFWAGRNFRIEQIGGGFGSLFSPYDPVILAQGDVTLDNYKGESLHILAGGSVRLGNVTIDAAGASGTTINPNNPDSSLSGLSIVPLSNGESLTIDGSQQATLDVRAGIDWAALGGFPAAPSPIGTIPASSNLNITTTSSRADISVGKVMNSPENSLVLLTNQYHPNSLPGDIQVDQISTTGNPVNRGSVVIDSRGNFTLRTKDGVVSDAEKSIINAAAPIGDKNGGNITILAGREVLVDNARIVVGSAGSGKGGLLKIKAQSLTLLNNSSLEGDVYLGNGQGGSFDLDIADTLRIDGTIADGFRPAATGESTRISAGTLGGSGGNAGNVEIKAGTFLLQNGGTIKSSSGGTGNAGNIHIIAGTVDISGSVSQSGFPSALLTSTAQTGKGGDITISAGTFRVTEGALVSALVQGTGAGGNINIQAERFEAVNGGQLIATTTGNGTAGNIEITAKQFILSGTESNYSERQATLKTYNNDIAKAVLGTSSASGLFNAVKSESAENAAGNITVTGNTIELLNGSVVEADSDSVSSPPGIVSLNAQDRLEVTNSQITSTSKHDSEGYGQIFLESAQGSMSLNDATITAQNEGNGLAGDIFFTAHDRIDIANSKISSNGYYGRIFVMGASDIYDPLPEAQTIVIRGSKLTTTNASISGKEKAGDIFLRARGNTEISGSTLSGFTTGQGLGGTVDIKTGSLFFNNSDLDVATSGAGNAGDVNVIAQNNVSLQNGTIRAGSAGQGNAGNVTVTASNTISLQQNSRIFSTVEEAGTGKGGDVTLSALTIALSGRSAIEVDNNSKKQAGVAGNINFQTGFLKLDQSSVRAETVAGEGGSISIEGLKLLLLRHDSQISSTAGSQQNPGNGGKITIKAAGGFVIAVPQENSDIIANAFGGKGGAISISANRILGLTQRSRLTPTELKAIRTNGISDISASSDVGADGDISTSTLQVDPSQGLTEIPVDLVDPSNLIAQNCQPGSAAASRRSEFVITGRGGLPPKPGEVQSSDVGSIPWVRSDPSVAQKLIKVAVAPPVAAPLVEAQGITIAASGAAFLTTQTTIASPHPSKLSKSLCASSNR